MICMQCRHKVTGELCRCQCGHSRRLVCKKERPPVCSWALLTPAFNPISENGKITPLSESAGGGHLLGLLKAVSQLTFLLGFHWAKIYWTESPSLPCSKGCEIHLGAVNTHSSFIQVLFPAGVRSTLERASLSALVTLCDLGDYLCCVCLGLQPENMMSFPSQTSNPSKPPNHSSSKPPK